MKPRFQSDDGQGRVSLPSQWCGSAFLSVRVVEALAPVFMIRCSLLAMAVGINLSPLEGVCCMTVHPFKSPR